MRTHPLRSSMIAAMGYNPETETMVAVFPPKGEGDPAVYKYSGVPSGTFESILASESHGKAFNEFVKNRDYPYEQIDLPAVENL